MKKKIGTVLDEGLIDRARRAADLEGKTLASLDSGTPGRLIAEARSRGLIVASGPARRQRESPDVVRSLHRYLDITAALAGCGPCNLDLNEESIRLSHPIRERFGLLVNDSLLVATSLAQDIPVLAPSTGAPTDTLVD